MTNVFCLVWAFLVIRIAVYLGMPRIEYFIAMVKKSVYNDDEDDI